MTCRYAPARSCCCRRACHTHRSARPAASAWWWNAGAGPVNSTACSGTARSASSCCTRNTSRSRTSKPSCRRCSRASMRIRRIAAAGTAARSNRCRRPPRTVNRHLTRRWRTYARSSQPVTVDIDGSMFRVDLHVFHDLAIAQDFDGAQPRWFDAPPAHSTALSSWRIQRPRRARRQLQLQHADADTALRWHAYGMRGPSDARTAGGAHRRAGRPGAGAAGKRDPRVRGDVSTESTLPHTATLTTC